MAGGFAVIKDVFKLLVYRLVRWRNEREGRDLIPASVLERPPSAELRPDQLDADSLPPYEVLDRILEAYVERDEGVEALVAEGLPEETVMDVVRVPLDVELTGTLTLGMTVADFRTPAPADCTTYAATNLDHARFWDLVLDALERIGEP